MNIELKNVKFHASMSEETNCFEATIYVDGKKIGDVNNRGYGGPNDYHYTDKARGDAFEKYCRALPPHVYPAGNGMVEFSVPSDEDCVIDELFSKWLHAKEMKRLCKGRTLFRVSTIQYKEGEWSVVKAAFTPQVEEYLVKKYGSTLTEIANKN